MVAGGKRRKFQTGCNQVLGQAHGHWRVMFSSGNKNKSESERGWLQCNGQSRRQAGTGDGCRRLAQQQARPGQARTAHTKSTQAEHRQHKHSLSKKERLRESTGQRARKRRALRAKPTCCWQSLLQLPLRGRGQIDVAAIGLPAFLPLRCTALPPPPPAAAGRLAGS